MNVSITEETRIVRLLCFMVPFAIINSYMLNIALPDIAKEFAISPSTTSWVVISICCLSRYSFSWLTKPQQ